ncbi:MAG: AmmeMemoRadiSam system radical SAM enzyme [Lachnospiraceae bacterium]|nr:AmmeMemoRadiSam system radical SAM enzyme [Lachnospiraceae bacterium]
MIEKKAENKVCCKVCFRHCSLADGETGACRTRKNKAGEVVSINYGVLTSLALDPIEKKPLSMFCPGSMILSAGSFGCNLRCPFCQNHEISYAGEREAGSLGVRYISPEELVDTALRLKERGNIGIAFTYNEPLMSWEYVRDAASLSHEKGMKNVLVSNGTAEPEVLREILPFIDAMNIDLKAFDKDKYSKILGGDLEQTQAFISEAAKHVHMEITTLVVPGFNDDNSEIENASKWIASLNNGKNIPYHLTRFFPGFNMTDRDATPVNRIFELRDIAAKYLDNVYVGNV